jgi:hypothetical protein
MPAHSIRSDEIERRVLNALREGIPLAVICREIPMADSTWRDWCDADESLAFAYARAREVGFDKIASDCLEVADAKPADAIEVQHAKLRIETRLKLLAKWDPRRYGDKVALTGGSPDDAPIRTESRLDVSGLSAETLREIARVRVEG